MVSKFGALGFAVACLSIGLAIPADAPAQPAGCPPVEKGVIKTCNTAEPRNDGYWNWDLFLVSDEAPLYFFTPATSPRSTPSPKTSTRTAS